MSMPVIEILGLDFAYPDGTEALKDIDLHIHRGERVALLGPNGAGKTTLILHMNGIHQAQRGTVTVSGLPVTAPNLLEIRRRVGLVFQDPDDQLFMPTVREDVEFGPRNLRLSGAELDQRVGAALAALEVADLAHRAPNHLSFGQKRRVSMAGVMAMHPEILVLDEPTSNLDPASRQDLTRALLSLDVTQLIVTHDLLYALEVCPRSVIIDSGRIVADGPTATLLADARLLAAHRLALPAALNLLAQAPTPAGEAVS
ncbi:MAG: energy-coupling factor ABC transporter ATP-binding protein [Actinomycetota bacterium]|nr:energy-coupling factor ABC transporter ATP-binding protein [Actinomycetota bacterium]